MYCEMTFNLLTQRTAMQILSRGHHNITPQYQQNFIFLPQG